MVRRQLDRRAAGGASGFATTGTGSISQTGVNLPAGSSITYTVTATIDPARQGSFTNTATVMPHCRHRRFRDRY
jgi:hypothetical protein